MRTVRCNACCQTLLIFAVIFLQAEWTTPQVNEAHYLAKAKHYWNPAWCSQDPFLQSADAHLVFYWSLGWLTCFLPMPVVAWIGRLACWLFIAGGLQRMGSKLFGGACLPTVAAAGLFLILLNRFDMAGEWIVGGFEAKLISYGCVFFAIAALLADRWSAAIIWLGIAALFHILVGGWMLLALGLAWLISPRNRPGLNTLLPALAVAGGLTLVSFLPAQLLGQGISPAERQLAYGIYTYQRLAHHLVFHRIWDEAPHKVFRHAGLILIWVCLLWSSLRDTQQRRISWLVLAAIFFAAIGVTIDFAAEAAGLDSVYSDLAFRTLRFYWFRTSDVLVPLGVAYAAIGWGISMRLKGSRMVTTLTAAIAMIFVVQHIVQARTERWGDPRPAACRRMIRGVDLPRKLLLDHYQAWREVCEWIRNPRNTPPDSLWLTPRLQRSFKWYAQRADLANWKDVPQDAKSLTEWFKRYWEVYNPNDVWFYGLAVHDSDSLVALARKYKVQFILLDRDNFYQYDRKIRHSALATRFENEFYRVYEVQSE